MLWIAIVCGVLVVAGVGSAGLYRSRPLLALELGLGGSVAACVLGAVASAVRLLSAATPVAATLWGAPLGDLRVGLDPLSDFFLLCICVVSALAALYGVGYCRKEVGSARLGAALLSFNLLVVSMIGVVISRDVISFLISWEVMTLFSFFLVGYEHDRPEVRRAGFLYLAASQVGVVFIFVLFGLLAKGAGSYRFDLFAADPGSGLAAVCFLLALVGFGTKAGFWMLHIWLPEAHPAAPSHVSALMSGVLIKLGIYGLLRAMMFMGPPPVWWGILLLAVGIFSGIAGVLQAFGQHDLKRLLAYHSIENIGIIVLGLGVGTLGRSMHEPAVAWLGFAGGILHVLNHGLFKGLLFHGAGAVLREAGTRNVEVLGGLLKRMPVTGTTFLTGCAAISGLPPLNGFVSEWLIYAALFFGALRFEGLAVGACVAGIVGLALIGGLAAACFAKAFGIVFLGEPRSKLPAAIRDPGRAMRVAMLVGAGLCLWIGLCPGQAVLLVAGPVESMIGSASLPPAVLASLAMIARTAVLVIFLSLALVFLRRKLLSGREVTAGSTWGCGYEEPSARMQYTASSFAQPMLASFGAVLKQKRRLVFPQGFFPSGGHFTEHLVDLGLENVWVPASIRIVALFRRLRFLQQGRLQWYLLYILITLIGLLLWTLR